MLVLLIATGSCPVTALLKRGYILFGLGLLLVVGGVADAPLSFRFGTLLGVVGFVVWMVAASRLAAPESRWARQLYDPQKLARSRSGWVRRASPISRSSGLSCPGRIVVTFVAVLIAVACLADAVTGRPTDAAWTLVVAGAVLVVAGLAALWTGSVGAYLRAADRPRA